MLSSPPAPPDPLTLEEVLIRNRRTLRFAAEQIVVRASRPESPAERVMVDQLAERLCQVLAGMSRCEQMMFRLAHVERKTQREIAAILECSVTLVDFTLQDVFERLRRRIYPSELPHGRTCQRQRLSTRPRLRRR